MPSRVERHEERGNVVTKRTLKNQKLYQDIKDYSDYQEITKIESVIENPVNSIGEVPRPKRRRESVKVDVFPTEKLSSVLLMNEEKEYDINKVLKSAKRDRVDVDQLEEKRKLKKDEYNIVTEIGLENIDAYREKREKEVLNEEDQEELKELIDTIYSKTLKQDLEEASQKKEENMELLGDLLPSEEENTLINEELTKMLIEEERQAKEQEKLDDSFFTKSNDLTENDLLSIQEMEEEEEEENFFDDVEEKNPKWIWIPIVLAVLIVVGVVIYFLSQGL